MKQFLFSLLVLFAEASSAQQPTTTVVISVLDCRPGDHERFQTDTMYLYDESGNHLVRKFIPEPFSKKDVILENIPPGTYLLKYKNMFRQCISSSISFSDKKTNHISICIDEPVTGPGNNCLSLIFLFPFFVKKKVNQY